MSYRRQWLLLLGIGIVILAAGVGMRDPWPADEPRFALIARDMVETGNWLLPRVGGVLYPDKPPLFFWAVAASYVLTGSIAVALLLPGVVAGLGVLLLVTDLARRLWGERTAIWCGATLLALVQFPLQMKSGQIDGWLCFMTTLSLYGLTRHLLLGPDWRWYAAGGFFAGLGVVTKGVGFLPLLLLVPYALAASFGGWSVPRPGWRDGRWLLAPLSLLLAIALWLGPMLLATRSGGDFAAYRDDILFHQTVMRYADSWGHIKPAWYLFTNAVPWLWLPATILLPWLAPRWRQDLKAREAPVLLLGAWVVLVLLFFSLSHGKRSLYIFPAAPAFAMLAGLHAEELFKRGGVRGLFAWLAGLTALAVFAGGGWAYVQADRLAQRVGMDGPALAHAATTLMALGAAMLAFVAWSRSRRVLLGYAGSLAALWIGLSVLTMPAIDHYRSGANLVEKLEAMVPESDALALVDWKEQFLLQLRRPVHHFGYRRTPAADARDGAWWLAQADGRHVLLPDHVLGPCYDPQRVRAVGRAHRNFWVLADREALTGDCVGSTAPPPTVVLYTPPGR